MTAERRTPTKSARRQAKRRNAISRGIRRFEALLPDATGLSLPRLQWPSLSLAWTGFSGWVWAKLASLTLLGAVVAALVWIHSDPAWFVYREAVHFQGLRLLNEEELFATTGVDGWNLLWLRTSDVRENLLQHPYVANATVRFTLPATIQVTVKEEDPVVVWVTGQGDFFVAQSGDAVPVNDKSVAGLPRLVDPMQQATPLAAHGRLQMDPTIVQSTFALLEQFPGLTEVGYSTEVGLNFGLPGSALWVYWGDGEHIAEKLSNLQAGQRLIADGQRKSIVDVRFPGQPFIR